MSLKSCGDCEKQISTEAAFCPNCGRPSHEKKLAITVSDIDIKFASMVNVMVKAVFAAIPAALIVAIIVGLAVAVASALFGRH